LARRALVVAVVLCLGPAAGGVAAARVLRNDDRPSWLSESAERRLTERSDDRDFDRERVLRQQPRG
jgi:hypothetical protein